MTGEKPKYSAAYFHAGDSPEAAAEFRRFRKRLFVDRLGWDLAVEGDEERDQFDGDDACYCALRRTGELVGGFRAIRTDRPYLADRIFPSLAVTQKFPHRRDVWEISRFGVLPLPNRLEMARLDYALMFRFGYLRRATAFVAVADIGYERFLRSLGIRTARYGPPRALARDTKGRPMMIVAGEIRLADQSGPRFQRLLDHARLAEITDETLVLGRRGISA